ncbi:MAG: IclR family transcriptional regulator [Alphaproteobacteria bacterium]|nr:MAG: IclR family transcriptional regulator [Alphaproteobacteria bacterium]
MNDHKARTGKEAIPTNLRILRLIEEIVQAGSPLTASALSAATGLARPTVHRLLATAEAEGFLQRHVDARSWGPGRRLRQLAASALSSDRIRTERLMVMQALAREVGETCNLAAPDRDGMIYLDRVETHWPLRIQLPIGSKVPLHCTASGKLYLSSLRTDKLDRLLAWLPLERHTPHTLTDAEALREELAQTRKRGYAVDDEEFMEGMAAVSVPIRDAQGRLLSTLSVHAPVQRHKLESLLTMLPRLRDAAARIEALCLD